MIESEKQDSVLFGVSMRQADVNCDLMTPIISCASVMGALHAQAFVRRTCIYEINALVQKEYYGISRSMCKAHSQGEFN